MSSFLKTIIGFQAIRVAVAFFFLSLILMLIGCSTADDQANNFYKKGMELYQEDEMLKAQLEFKNALQIKNNMVPAWYGLALIAERNGDLKQLYSLLKKIDELDPEHIDSQLKLGKLMMSSGQIDAALEISDRTILLNKSRADVLALRSAVFFRLDDREKAVTYARSALKINPTNADALLVLASERLASGDPAKAIEYLDKGLSYNEYSIAMHLIKIKALEKLKNQEDAEGVYQRLANLYPETRTFRHILANFYVTQGRSKEAENQYKRIIEENPGDLQAMLDLVRFVQSIKGYVAAVDQLKSFIEIKPDNTDLKLSLASLYKSNNDRPSAETIYRALIQDEENVGVVLKAKGLLAASYLADNKMEDAVRLVNEILTEDEHNEQALILKADISISSEDIDQAIADLRTVLRDAPDSAQAMLLLAKAYHNGGSYQLALDQYQRAYVASKKKSYYGKIYANYLLQNGKLEKAEDVLIDMLNREPGDISTMKLLALVHLNQGDWVEAEVLADKIRRRGDSTAASDQILGAIYAGRQEYEKSIEAFKQAYAVVPEQTQPLIALVRIYIRANKLTEAKKFLENVVEVSPQNVTVLSLLGNIALLEGDTKKALESFDLVINIDPGNVSGYFGLTSIYIREKHYSKAEQILEQALDKRPDSLRLQLSKAGLLELMGRYEDAIEQYEAILDDQSESDIVTNNLATLLSDHRDDQESLTTAYKIAQRFSSSEVPYFMDTLGWASYRVGKYEEGEMYIRRAIERIPTMPIFHYHMGMIKLAQGDLASAKDYLMDAAELAGENDPKTADAAKKAIKGLQ
jgi:tetratricopeptide (TPR) repeat protein